MTEKLSARDLFERSTGLASHDGPYRADPTPEYVAWLERLVELLHQVKLSKFPFDERDELMKRRTP